MTLPALKATPMVDRLEELRTILNGLSAILSATADEIGPDWHFGEKGHHLLAAAEEQARVAIGRLQVAYEDATCAKVEGRRAAA